MLANRIEKAHERATKNELKRHATEMLDIAHRFDKLRSAVVDNGLAICPECGAAMKHLEDDVFFRWICEDDKRHSGGMRL